MSLAKFYGLPADDTASCKAILMQAFPGVTDWKRISKRKEGLLNIRVFKGATFTVEFVTTQDGKFANLVEIGSTPAPTKPAPKAPAKTSGPKGKAPYFPADPTAFFKMLCAMDEDKLPGEDGEFNPWSILGELEKTPDGGTGRIEFDLENWEINNGFGNCTIVGLHTLGDLPFVGVTAGGDWETPLFFIIYPVSATKAAGYIPTAGNVYNYEAKSAFGNNEDSDNKISYMLYKTAAHSMSGQLNNEKLVEDIRKHFGLPKTATLTAIS